MKQSTAYRATIIGAGILFALLWASASAATKIALQAAQPFVIAVARFLIAAAILLAVAHIILKKRLPAGQEWKQIACYGLLNISIYLGLYVIAMVNVSAGLGTLAVGTNPVFISIIAAVWMRHSIRLPVVMSLVLCTVGITLAAYPLLQKSYATPQGLIILLISMLSYSAGAVYFSKKQWNDLNILVINGWQTLLGGIFLLPFLFFFYDGSKNVVDARSVGGILWLAIPVSIGAVQSWLFLLKDNPVKASSWLFLCPVFGFMIAAATLHEPISGFTFAGVALVITGLYIIQRKK